MSVMTPMSITGTTCLAMTCSGGNRAVVAADSRMCQGEYIVSDDTQKIFQLTKNIVCLFAGSVRLNARVLNQLRILVNGGGSAVYTPELLASVALDCFHSYRDLGDSSDATICGWDNTRGVIQIYYLDMSDADLRKPVESVAHGTGSTHAQISLIGHTPDVTLKNATSRAIRGLCNASFFDLFTGGVMNVVYITKDACTPIYKEESLIMYRDNFGHHSNQHVVFLLVPHKTKPVNIRTLGDWFSLCHVIVPPHRVSKKKDFSFHRLILGSAKDVAIAMEHGVEDLGAMPEDGVEEVNCFRLGVRIHDVLRTVVYVVPATQENLMRIINMP